MKNPHVYYYDMEYVVMKGYISEEKVIDIYCGSEHLILLTQIGKVNEY